MLHPSSACLAVPPPAACCGLQGLGPDGGFVVQCTGAVAANTRVAMATKAANDIIKVINTTDAASSDKQEVTATAAAMEEPLVAAASVAAAAPEEPGVVAAATAAAVEQPSEAASAVEEEETESAVPAAEPVEPAQSP